MTLKMRMSDKNKMDRLPPTEPPEGAMVVYCKTHEPVIWNVWIGFEPEDVGSLVGLALKPSTVSFVVKSLFKLAIARLGFKKKEDEKAIQGDPVKT